jgi:hypothetical protein
VKYEIKIQPAEGGFIVTVTEPTYENRGSSIAALAIGSSLKTTTYVCTSVGEMTGMLAELVGKRK